MLRSVGDGDWKLKQDTDEYRVMYREGPQGNPLHSLLVEGFVDGPTDVCVCLGWEVALFHRWWPRFNFPTFKIIESKCVQKVRIGEQIALVRMKCAWPFSAREVVVHCFEVTNTETQRVLIEVHMGSPMMGYLKYKRQNSPAMAAFCRTLMTMDMKLDSVPPSLINFLSRQIIGSGFELYKKAVASVAKGDEDFGKALKDTLCVRIHKYHGKSETESLPADATVTAKSSLGDHLVIRCKQADTVSDGIESFDQYSSRLTGERINKEKKVVISAEVEHAIGILNNVISMVRGSGINIQTWSGLGSTNQELVNSGTIPQDHSGVAIFVEALKTDKKDANLSKHHSEVIVEVNGIHEGSNIN
ncbi:uncharacterized protein LOC113296588 [Papaver somniferum]|uniref:uncharacterized protein LOC113296588 n=1 Tax=Papaver somniferum TaxID=3469 RepID=UPI000E7047F0|nr:uncharacterized protein LOC113296588 [Papaver somniferum]